MSPEEQLKNLRNEIDKIDDVIYEQIMNRTKIVLEIAKIKKQLFQNSKYINAWNPAREISILRRLIAKRNDSFPKASIFRIWREMFGALTNLQSPFLMAVFMPQRGAGFLEIARDQFGAYSDFTVCSSIGQIIREVTENKASVGVIPIDNDNDSTSPWWIKMLSSNESNIKIVARISQIGPGEGRGGGKEAYVLAKAPFEGTGEDRTLIVIEVSEKNFSIGALKQNLKKFNIDIERFYADYMMDDKQCAYLAETNGYLKEDDPKIKKLYDSNSNNISKITILGGYAIPFNLQTNEQGVL